MAVALRLRRLASAIQLFEGELVDLMLGPRDGVRTKLNPFGKEAGLFEPINVHPGPWDALCRFEIGKPQKPHGH